MPLTPGQLALRFGLKRTTITTYVRRGLLPKVEKRGPGTLHSDEAVLRLEVIQRLGGTHKNGIEYFKTLFATKSRSELEKLADSASRSPKYRGRMQQAWHRITLAPGVELHIEARADDDAQRVADEIIARYGR